MNVTFLSQNKIGLNSINRGSNKKAGQKGNVNGSDGNSKVKSDESIDALNKQKETLEKSKGSIMANAAQTNESKATLDDKLAAIDKQISEIDKQISKIRNANQSEPKTSSNKKSNDKQSSNSNKKDTQAQSAALDMNPLLKLASKLDRSRILYKEAAAETNEVNELKSDIKLDEQRGVNPVRDRERVSELEDNIENIYEKYGNSIGEADNPKNSSKSEAASSDATEAAGKDKTHTLQNKVIEKYKGNIKGNIRKTGQVFNEPA